MAEPRPGSLKDRVALVTGAARGIGRNVARRLGVDGARVLLADLNEVGGREVCQAFRDEGLNVEFVPTDLAMAGAGAALVHVTLERRGRLDILVNNARGRLRPGQDPKGAEAWEAHMGVSLRAAWEASEVALESMGSGGAIVNIASIASVLVTPEPCLYHMSKAALLQMTRVHAVQGGPKGIRVNALLPGFIVQDEHRSRFEEPDNEAYRALAAFAQPLGRVGTSDEVAEAARFLCGEEASFITGQALGVDGGLGIQDPSALLFRWERSR